MIYRLPTTVCKNWHFHLEQGVFAINTLMLIRGLSYVQYNTVRNKCLVQDDMPLISPNQCEHQLSPNHAFPDHSCTLSVIEA